MNRRGLRQQAQMFLKFPSCADLSADELAPESGTAGGHVDAVAGVERVAGGLE